MGPDKNGRVRMYGSGVSPSLVFKDMANSETNHIAAIKCLQEHNKKLNDELDYWKSLANVPTHEELETDETQVAYLYFLLTLKILRYTILISVICFLLATRRHLAYFECCK